MSYREPDLAPVIKRSVRRTICGLDELAALGPQATHILSILDPDFPEPANCSAEELQDHLCLRFHDILKPQPGLVVPEPQHIDTLLAFGRSLMCGKSLHLLVHCHMGVSRSTAAMAALLAQANPEADERAVMSHVSELRPQAWPNMLMISLADEQLGRGGRLVEALRALYAYQIGRNPELAYVMAQHGRRAEVEFATS